MSSGWKKCENEAGFPYYIRDGTLSKRWNHPIYDEIFKKANKLSNIKYATYRMAFKIKMLQDNIRVPCARLVAAVFARHCLSISENSLVLEPSELEAILADIYFAAQKEGTFDANPDVASEIALSFLLSAFDGERTSSISIQSAKTALFMLCNDSNRTKWRFLFAMMADHNSCVSPRRLASLLIQMAIVAEYLGEETTFGRRLVQTEVDKCFAKTPGMLGLSESGFLQWMEGESPPHFLSWMDVRERLEVNPIKDENSIPVASWKCAVCEKRNPSGLKFKCTKCWGMMVCEKCYLFSDMKCAPSNSLYKHKSSHVIKEIIDAQGMPSRRILSLVKNMKRMLTLPSNCRRGDITSDIHYPLEEDKNREQVKDERVEPNKHKVYTSTVGKANGKIINDPKIILHDIITKLESQNRALKSISTLLNDAQNKNSMDRRIQHKVDGHFSQIATQINRLKMFQENLLPDSHEMQDLDLNIPTSEMFGNITIQKDNRAPFEVFSPIPLMPKDCINETTVMEHKNLNMGSNDCISGENNGKQINELIYKNIDSISNVSMSDISIWYGKDAESNRNVSQKKSNSKEHPLKSKKKSSSYSHGLKEASEEKFNADIESVATSNNKMKELNADLDSVLDRLQTILTNNFALDEMSFDNNQLQETANEMEGLLGSLIRGVEQRRTIRGDKI